MNRTGETRSAVFERALRSYLDREHGAEQTRCYVDAYHRLPKGRRDIEDAIASAIPTLA